jgi:hypothetical protein
MEFLGWLENTGFATWVRESNSPLAYTLFLYAHAIGLGLLVGFSTMICLRILGFAPRLPFAPMAGFYPVMRLGFWVNALSGVVLWLIAATEFTTNPTFWIKLAAIAVAIVALLRLERQAFGGAASLDRGPIPANVKGLAWTTLAAWTVAIVAGRSTAYHWYTIRATILACLVLIAVLAVVVTLARFSRFAGGRVPHPRTP